VRLLLASAAVALLVVVWLPSRDASRARSKDGAGTSPPPAASGPGEAEARPVEPASDREEKGPGEEGEIYRITVVSARDGAPIAGATAAEGKDILDVTGADGVAEIRGRGYSIRVSAPGCFPKSFWPGSDHDLWLILSPGAPIAGKVIDAATRRPIAGAKVAVRTEDSGLDSAPTDEAGRFELPGALWQPYTLTARAEGYTPTQVEGTLTGPVRDVELALVAGGTLEGTVFLADGSPGIRQHVELRTGKKRVPVVGATTDKQGYYRISGVPLGVEVTPWTQADFAGDPVVFRDANEVLRRDIRYPTRVQLIASATGPSGEAIELRQATVANAHRSVTGRPPAWLTAPPGNYRLSVWADGWPSQERDIVLTSGGAHEAFVFGSGLVVEGTVVSADGQPLEEVMVQWTDGSTRTDAQGRFRLAGLEASPMRLEVTAWGDYADTRVEGVVPGGPPIVVTMPPSAEIRATVLGCGDEVQWCRDRGWGRQPLEKDGRIWFIVADLSAGVRLALRRDLHAAPVVFSFPPLQPGEVRDLGEIRFPAGRTVVGRVLGADKAPVACAVVAVAEHWAEDGPPHVVRTDGAGRFNLLWMPESPFSVRVDADGWPPHFFLMDGGAVDLRLSRGGVVEGSASMRIRPTALHESARNGEIRPRRDPDGRFWARLQPGEYREERLGTFVVREGETTELTPR
jgi:hypothetical protein